MSDDFVPIPPEFWRNFIGDPVEERRRGSVIGKLWPDGRITYEDWEAGNFTVITPQPFDAPPERVTYLGCVVSRANVERLWPRKG